MEWPIRSTVHRPSNEPVQCFAIRTRRSAPHSLVPSYRNQREIYWKHRVARLFISSTHLLSLGFLSPPSALAPIGDFDRAHLDTQQGIGAGLKWRSYPGECFLPHSIIFDPRRLIQDFVVVFFGWGCRLEQQESGGVEGAGEECRKRRSDRWVHPHPAHPWISLQVVYDFGAFLVICSSSISWLGIWQSRIRI